jgi:hypothetical protein
MQIINVGLYCNESEKFLFLDDVFAAHWLRHTESGEFAFVPKEQDGFEIMGSSRDEDVLNELSDDDLASADVMAEKGWEVLPLEGRLFCTERGALLLSPEELDAIKEKVAEKKSKHGKLMSLAINSECWDIAGRFESISYVDCGWVEDYIDLSYKNT